MKHMIRFSRVRAARPPAVLSSDWTAATENAAALLARLGLFTTHIGERALVRNAEGLLVFSTAEPRHLELWADGVAMGAQCEREAALGRPGPALHPDDDLRWTP